MCFGCYDDLGSPVEINDQVRYLSRLLSVCDDGGPLHIIIADWNIDDEDLTACWDIMLQEEKADRTGQAAIVRTVLCIMGPMSEEMRATALAINDGYLDIDGNPTKAAVNLANIDLAASVARAEAKQRLH